MKRLTKTTTILLCALLASCVSYNAYQSGKNAERVKNWDEAVIQYEKALEISPDNVRYRIDLQRARLEASRAHFEKGKSLEDAARGASGREEQVRLAQLASTELEVTVKLDPTNQYAAVELGKTIGMLTDLSRASAGETIDDVKRRAKASSITKEKPPELVPSSDQPITLTFPRETPVRDIYKALGNAFGINMMFDQALKDDRISIELKDVTAQQALERVMQAANHFYKALDDHTIIIIPDNPQARRDYEDLVIRTFYLSNGDAELVTNVVRTMLEARNVFPLKALNAITIRDTADKVRIAEKIIEANDKAKAEVVVDVELVQLDLDKARELGFVLTGTSGSLTPLSPTDKGNVALTAGTINDLRRLNSGLISFSIPGAAYSAVKSIGNSQLLANPELRISEGEKASLHIGNRIPVPVTSFPTISSGTPQTGLTQQITSYQYQDVGIKVAIEPRVHHNREVTLKLTVEVSNQGPDAPGTGVGTGQAAQPTFITRTIESTIRLKDGETNFLAGLIQQNDTDSDQKTPFLGDLPVIGRLFTNNKKRTTRTDLVLTMTPHIIRIPDITEDDMAPMWVGTQNNLSFRGLSPRLESQTNVDPFAPRQGNQPLPAPPRPNAAPGTTPRPVSTPPRGMPSDPFRPTKPVSQGDNSSTNPATSTTATTAPIIAAASVAAATTADDFSSLSPRISPQPVKLAIKAGEEKTWTVVGMDLDGLTTSQIMLHYNPRTIDVSEVVFGPAMLINAKTPPVVKIDGTAGTITITSSDSNPLAFTSGGDIAILRVRGGMPGETFLVLENPGFKNGRGEGVASVVAGGRAKVE